MWMIKGTLYGVTAFVVFALFYYLKAFPPRPNRAISLSVLRYLTYGNPWFWAAFVLMVCTGLVCARLLAERKRQSQTVLTAWLAEIPPRVLSYQF